MGYVTYRNKKNAIMLIRQATRRWRRARGLFQIKTEPVDALTTMKQGSVRRPPCRSREKISTLPCLSLRWRISTRRHQPPYGRKIAIWRPKVPTLHHLRDISHQRFRIHRLRQSPCPPSNGQSSAWSCPVKTSSSRAPQEQASRCFSARSSITAAPEIQIRNGLLSLQPRASRL
ncbi:uncharacterized protein B0H18DRAFT_656000 [Fomitopsis serialis]|uniref:uncharacterized protein n=1 Tax=Fomitopsis serialis TaxID=139415 RepID=UPI002007D9CE|nr:uncharacterized protein B0H18DRAFT_656000 [Neoantrodia serialis]KAH9919132.1 hypothetical protein B0H18DRAFT_656000 [Neoantrodia serialis]